MRCTRGQIEDFSRSAFWSDCCEEIDVWLKEIRDQLENSFDGEGHLIMDQRALDRLGGCAEGVRRLKTLPEVLIGRTEMEEESVESEDVSP